MKSKIISPIVLTAIIVFFFLAAMPASAEVTELWSRSYDGGYDDWAEGVATDAEGNVIVTGSSFDGSTYNYYTIKYDKDGNELWSRTYDGGSGDGAGGVATDAEGNVIVIGCSGDDYYTIKYDSNGNEIWHRSYDGGYDDCALGVATDAGGNVVVTGYSSTSDWIFNTYTIKYDNAGNVIWSRSYDGGMFFGCANAVATDADGNVIITGMSSDGIEYHTVKYDSNGNKIWDKIYDGTGYRVATDTSGNVIVTGGSSDGYYTIKYDSAGDEIWSRSYSGGSSDWATGVATDTSGNVIVTGTSLDSSTWEWNYYTIKYSADGVELWNIRYVYGRSSGEPPDGVVVTDAEGNVIVTGWSDEDYLTIKYGETIQPPTCQGKIAFASSRDGNQEVYVINADDSGHPIDLSNFPDADDGDPTWSPDGKQIAFSSNRSGNWMTYVMDADDGSNQVCLLEGVYDAWGPAWSPDGKKIAFACQLSSDDDFEIYTMDIQSKALTQVTDNSVTDCHPAWSPNSHKIVFTSTRDGNHELYVADLLAGTQTRLTDEPAYDDYPEWSPDGSMIVFVSERDGNQEIYSMNIASKAITRLTYNEHTDKHAQWSPDGQKICFVSNRDGGSDLDVYVMNADGTSIACLVDWEGDETHPTWSPIESPDLTFVYLCSPGELRVYDSQGRVTGLVNGEIKEEIPNSTYNEEMEMVMILSSSDSFTYEVKGTDEGSYGLRVATIKDREFISFTATNIPTSANTIHQYFKIDWNALSQGEEGVTVQVDSDGDGTFEDTFTADNELTREEFLSSTKGIYIESSDVTGGIKDIFAIGESVYAIGSGYAASTTYNLYVVNDTTWTDGLGIPTRVAGTETTVTTDGYGKISAGTLIWASATIGKYDIIVDVNGNGVYDEDTDPIDNMDVNDAGFETVPEFTTIAIPVAIVFGLVFLISRRKRRG